MITDLSNPMTPRSRGYEFSDVEAAALRKWVFERVNRDPLVHRYIRHLDRRNNGGSIPRNDEPWHAMGERLYAAFLLSRVGIDGDSRVGDSFYARFNGPHCALGLSCALLRGGVPYLWTQHVDDLVRASPALPSHVVDRNVMPHPLMFLSYEVVHRAVLVQKDEERRVDVDWMFLMNTEQGIQWAYPTVPTVDDDGRNGPSGLVFEVAGVPYGTRWPDDVPEFARFDVESVLKRLAFVNSPYTVTETRRLPRPMRRDYARVESAVRPQHEPVCHVVVLRRAVQTREQVRSDAIAQGRDWQHHWWVGGHFRAQWLPSTRSHKVIWIAPHVKGPLDKPLLEKTYAVTR